MFHLDFNGNNFTNSGELEVILENFVASQEMIYGKSPFRDSLGGRFEYVLKAAHERTGLRAVVLIDEYDKPILDVLDTQIKTSIKGEERLLEDWNREVLKGFYSVFKAADANLQFVLLTGVTKFSRISEIITIKVKMKHRILLPLLLQLVDGKPLEQFFFSLEIAFQGRYKQRLSKSSWTTQKVNCTIMNQIIDQACLVQINIAIFYDFLKVLYTDRIFHIAAVLNSFGKVTKNNDTSKGIARKK